MRIALVVLLLSIGASVSAAESISLQALFKDKAIFLIDGKRRVLARDEASPEGVKLISTDTMHEEAEIEIAGKRQTVKLGMVMAGFNTTGRSSIMLFAESNGHFFADGLVEGTPVRFMVDTGATAIALSSTHAARLGIDYKKRGRLGHASTAGGIVRMYALTLNNVRIGDITLYNIEAGVVEGNFPAEPLLGMSFLGQLNMKREGNQMELIQR
jgi:aspartyl protease family protein